jgi:hypothetical protein
MLLAFGKMVRQAGADFAYTQQVTLVPLKKPGYESGDHANGAGKNGVAGSQYNEAEVIAALKGLHV